MKCFSCGKNIKKILTRDDEIVYSNHRGENHQKCHYQYFLFDNQNKFKYFDFAFMRDCALWEISCDADISKEIFLDTPGKGVKHLFKNLIKDFDKVYNDKEKIEFAIYVKETIVEKIFTKLLPFK